MSDLARQIANALNPVQKGDRIRLRSYPGHVGHTAVVDIYHKLLDDPVVIATCEHDNGTVILYDSEYERE